MLSYNKYKDGLQLKLLKKAVIWGCVYPSLFKGFRFKEIYCDYLRVVRGDTWCLDYASNSSRKLFVLRRTVPNSEYFGVIIVEGRTRV